MTDRLITIALVVLVVAACLFVAFASDVFGSDAGPEEPPAAAGAEADPPAATTSATPAAPTDDATSALVTAVKQGVDGQWWAMIVSLITLAVWGLRYMAQNVGAFQSWVLQSKLGGPLFTLVVAFLITFGPRIADGPPGWGDVKVAGVAAVLAIGGWHALLKRFAIPLGQWVWAQVTSK